MLSECADLTPCQPQFRLTSSVASSPLHPPPRPPRRAACEGARRQHPLPRAAGAAARRRGCLPAGVAAMHLGCHAGPCVAATRLGCHDEPCAAVMRLQLLPAAGVVMHPDCRAAAAAGARHLQLLPAAEVVMHPDCRAAAAVGGRHRGCHAGPCAAARHPGYRAADAHHGVAERHQWHQRQALPPWAPSRCRPPSSERTSSPSLPAASGAPPPRH